MFIRFGRWYPDERSRIHSWSDDSVIGYEAGVSCWECVSKTDWRIIIPFETTGTGWTDLQGLVGDYSGTKKRVFLIDGDKVGIGHDGEPLVKNITFSKDITDEWHKKYK